MVRVMSIYHFASQSIQQLAIEELSCCCLIPPDEIALARNSDHTIEIRSLVKDSNDFTNNEACVKSFSSVDDVEKIIYSKHGYILTLESRISSYEKAEIRYVRIYVNWDKQSSPTQSLRARIAGKITPMKKTLEMIELPLNYNPSSIAVCPSTGNILVNHKNVLQIFIFKYCTNETTKFQYIDFFEAGFQVELDFCPTSILINEDVISCCNKQFFHVFKIVVSSDGNNSTTSESNICTSTEVPQSEVSANINLDQDVDFQAICDRSELNGNTFNVKIKSNQEESMGSMNDDDLEMRPSLINDLGAMIKYTNNLPESFSLPSKFCVKNLLQLKLQPMRISGVLRENVDVFKCMYMKPLYIKSDLVGKGFSSSDGTFFMHSKFRKNFHGCAVLITTQQDGYLYYINTTSHDHEAAKCFLNVYPFTSPVIDVFFNDNVLHALCENGIESYTHRIGQKILTNFKGRDYKEVDEIYKNLSTAISLVNLRPFMNVHFMIPGEDNIVLLANDSTTPQADNLDDPITWTIYDLKYPGIDTIYQDFKEFADKSLRKYPSVYMNLLEEIHLMIRNHMILARLEPEENSEVGNELKLVWNDCEDLLRDSSLALADFLILNPNECRQSLAFYEMSKLNLIGIFQRFLDQNQLIKNPPIGLIEVLKLGFHQLTSECDSRRFDEIFSTAIIFPNESNDMKSLKFGEALIELFKRFSPKEVAQLTLESTVFREYMDERIYEFLSDRPEKTNDEILCIILHLLKKDEVSAANSLLNQIQRDDLSKLLAYHWNILFEFSSHSAGAGSKKLNKAIISFSDITELLFLTISSNDRCELFTDVLLHHIYDTKVIRFNGILKLFMEYLASQLGHESYINGQNILKMLLEKYLLKYYETRSHDADISLLSTSSGNTATLSVSSAEEKKIDRKFENLSWNDEDLNSGVSSHRHAMRILVRIYLSQLKALSVKQEKRVGQDTRINKAQLIKVIDEMSSSLFINQKPVTKFDKIAQLLIQHAGTGPILFLDERYRYLDWMPPFENLLQVLSNVEEPENQYEYNKIDKDLLITLIKLQALLCSGEVSSEIAKEVLSYLQANRDQLIGHDSILVCLIPLRQAVDLIIRNNPQCILEYARCHFKLDSDWSYLIIALQKKANELEVSENNMGHILFYHRLLKETLEYLASSKPLDTVLKMFPEEKHLIRRELFAIADSKNSNEFDEYLKMCVDRERSDKIRKMIESTGLQLYEAINKN